MEHNIGHGHRVTANAYADESARNGWLNKSFSLIWKCVQQPVNFCV